MSSILWIMQKYALKEYQVLDHTKTQNKIIISMVLIYKHI